MSKRMFAYMLLFFLMTSERACWNNVLIFYPYNWDELTELVMSYIGKYNNLALVSCQRISRTCKCVCIGSSLANVQYNDHHDDTGFCSFFSRGFLSCLN